MFLLRRSAARAISSPSKTLFARPARSIATFTPAFNSRQQTCIASFQRRFASDDASKVETESSFAQTATEAPVEENVTPAEEAVAETPDAFGEEAPAPPFERKQRVVKDPAPPNTTLYVGNLYYEVTEDQLKRVFSRFGDIKSIKVIFDNRGLSRGFAYIEFETLDDAKSAVENLDMQVFEGRNLVVQYHRQKEQNRDRREVGGFTSPGASNTPTKTLFIGNMSFEMSDKDLNDLFRDIRNVVDVRVAIDRRTGMPRGFAHADFLDVASATKAIEELKGKVVYGRELRMDFSASHSNKEGGDRPRRDNREGGDRRDNREGGDRRDNRERREPRERRDYQRDE